MLGTQQMRAISLAEPGGFSDDPEDRAKQIFQKMDTNRDGILDEKEFIEGCLNDKSLMTMLTSTGKSST